MGKGGHQMSSFNVTYMSRLSIDAFLSIHDGYKQRYDKLYMAQVQSHHDTNKIDQFYPYIVLTL